MIYSKELDHGIFRYNEDLVTRTLFITINIAY